MSLARHLNPSGSGRATGWYQLAAQGGQTQRLCPLRDGLCRSLPGQSEIPKLVLRTPEPFGSSLGAAPSLLGRFVLLLSTSLPSSPPPCPPLHLPALLSFHKHRRAPIPGPPQSPPLLPLAASPSGTYSHEKFPQAPLPNPHLGFSQTRGIGKLERP